MFTVLLSGSACRGRTQAWGGGSRGLVLAHCGGHVGQFRKRQLEWLVSLCNPLDHVCPCPCSLEGPQPVHRWPRAATRLRGPPPMLPAPAEPALWCPRSRPWPHAPALGARSLTSLCLLTPQSDGSARPLSEETWPDRLTDWPLSLSCHTTLKSFLGSHHLSGQTCCRSVRWSVPPPPADGGPEGSAPSLVPPAAPAPSSDRTS